MANDTPLTTAILYLPTGLLVGLVLWTLVLISPAMPSSSSILLGMIAGIGGATGIVALRRPSLTADRAALFLVGAAFIGHGVGVRLGLDVLYIFLALVLVTAQLTAFRQTARPLLTGGLEDGLPGSHLGRVYVAFFSRQVTVIALTFFIAVMVFSLATALLFDFASDVMVALVAVLVILILVGISGVTR